MKKILLTALSTLTIMGTMAQNLSPKLTQFYRNIDEQIDPRLVKPLRIGISSSNYGGKTSVNDTYLQSVLLAGGEPIIIPPITNPNMLRNLVAELDGLVLVGGIDFDPLYFNEEPISDKVEIDSIRDIYDLTLIKLATDRNVPILGICRGEQGLNIAFGGTLVQDIPSQLNNTTVNHNQKEPSKTPTHDITIAPDSKLASILGVTSIATNSFHHQSVKDVGKGFRAVAHTVDGVIEAIEAYPHRPIMAVQFHPEGQVACGDTTMLKLFTNLMTEAETFRKAKNLHKRILSVDTHVDTPLCYMRQDGYNMSARDSNFVNFPKMYEGHVDAVFMAAYTAQGKRDAASSADAVEYITNMIKGIHLQATIHPEFCGVATSRDDLERLKAEGRKALFIGIENGYGIGKDIKNLQMYYDLGVRYMTLCHTKDNDICDTSSDTRNEWGGLSPYGKKVIAEMNRLGIMVDVSHAGITTFNDVIKLSTKPIIASHSSVRALCEHDRNLTDEQLLALKKNGGVVQICMVDLFINPDNPKASLDDAMEHIDYVVKLIGIDHVGIGSDFDGGGRLIGLEGANDMINITKKLIERGYTDKDIEKIWGGNFLRVMKDNEPAKINTEALNKKG